MTIYDQKDGDDEGEEEDGDEDDGHGEEDGEEEDGGGDEGGRVSTTGTLVYLFPCIFISRLNNSAIVRY